MKQFADMVSDKVIEYLRDAKTQDMKEVRNIISLHFSQGLDQALRNEEAELAARQAELIAEQRRCYNSPKRNAEINAQLLDLARQRKATRKASCQAQENGDLFKLKGFLRERAPELLEEFYTTIPKREKFTKL